MIPPPIERMEPRSDLVWEPVVRFFVGGPLDGRAIEGTDSREYEYGPMMATSDYWHGWILYEPEGLDERGWIIYRLHSAMVLDRAKKKYVEGAIDLAEFEQAVEWALASELEAA